MLFSAGLLLSSCVITQQYVSFPPEPVVEDGQATIYVLRPTIIASAVKVGVYQDDHPIGKLGPKGYLCWKVPGTGDAIEIMSKTENRRRITLTPLAGEVYYLEQSFGIGFAIARSKLSIINEEEGKEILSRLKAPKLAMGE